MRRLERIDVPETMVALLDMYVEFLERDPFGGPLDNIGMNLMSRIHDAGYIAMAFYLLEEKENAQEWGRRLIFEADRYFLGDWRQHVQGRDAVYWASGGGNWIQEYRASLAFAAALNDRAEMHRLSQFPNDREVDSHTWRSEAPWYLLLAEYLSHGASDDYQARRKQIDVESQKGNKLMAQALDAIVSKSHGDLAPSFAAAMNYFFKTQKKRRELQYKLALDGTILYHLAAEHDLPLELDDVTRDHLIIF